ncbi:NfeD family protein [Agrobacterium vitis]|uniref:NfeD family protein n=1 Tax=Agrobacterium vitis TaxID=373 RepID=A0A368NTD2_AGRVI|nr:NfeD family protein [Agrobacterium vitis]KAA3517615.1 NfeD family protein [Agrobacterium vitis]KAA3527016.1 NfeD family protein [Agrobacterium vitis]MCF1476956.1 NfeD family protein [Agrobacterium vitis]MUZ72708.1 NfeD family protein [Agrobacterium vitis]MUZ95860.1 NfeD family protein [Agrobacterium vitis]
MFATLVDQWGPWSWLVLGLALLAVELVMPGMFMIWIGLGAIATGLLSLAFWGDAFWPWQVQALVFCAFSIAAILIGRKYVRSDAKSSDEPLLNQRTASLVGRTATLQEPIREGRGRIRLDDTFWTVSGPDLETGTQVKIIAAHGRDLTVDAV